MLAHLTGPEHSHLKDVGRAEYVAVDDRGALDGLIQLARAEGIIAALESAHAIKYAIELAKTLPKDKTVLVCLSGRGDKDMNTIMQEMPKYYDSVKIPLEHDVAPTANGVAPPKVKGGGEVSKPNNINDL